MERLPEVRRHDDIPAVLPPVAAPQKQPRQKYRLFDLQGFN